MVIVPIEPTEEMLRAGLKAFALAESSDWSRQQVLQAVWQAMVLAQQKGRGAGDRAGTGQ